MRRFLACVSACVFLVMGCFPDKIPFVDEIVSFMLTYMFDEEDKAIVILMIVAHIVLAFTLCQPFVGLI